MLPARLRALIFDMDGLMVDSEPLWWRVEHAFARKHGVDWSDDLAQRCVGTGLVHLIRTMREHGLSMDVASGVSAIVDAFVAHIDELELKPGCIELIAAGLSANLRLAVASSSPKRLVHGVLDRFGLTPRFDAVVTGEAVARAKPAPDIFLLAANRIAAGPADLVVLEDSLAGVRAAVAAEMAVIAVPEHDPTPYVALTPHVVSDLHAARGLLGI